jgi:cysteine desulfurase/selenocysteine lyase
MNTFSFFWALSVASTAAGFIAHPTSQTLMCTTSRNRPLSVLKDLDTPAAPSEEAEDWWTGVELEHAGVAEKTRPDFEILLSTTIGESKNPLVYLDSAATSQKPKQVVDAVSHYYNKLNSNVHRGAHTLSRKATTAYEGARDKVASLINAVSRNEVIFTSGATEAINLVAYSYARTKLLPGDEIVVTEMEHHSNLVPWQMIAQETGAVVKYARIDFEKGELDVDHMLSLITDKTKIVGFQHVSNVMACINPVKDIVSAVRSKSPDSVILLDACQSVPHMEVDVQDLGVDFLVASGHKMCGPTGIGFLWGKEDILNSMPPFMGGGEMIDHVTLESSTFAKAPARFEAGTPPIAQAVGLGAAIDYLENIGFDNIEAYEHELAAYLNKRLREVEGVNVLGPPVGKVRAAVCAFHVDGVHPSDLSTFLDMEGVAIRAGHHCCQPLHQSRGISHSARASLYIYNTKE